MASQEIEDAESPPTPSVAIDRRIQGLMDSGLVTQTMAANHLHSYTDDSSMNSILYHLLNNNDFIREAHGTCRHRSELSEHRSSADHVKQVRHLRYSTLLNVEKVSAGYKPARMDVQAEQLALRSGRLAVAEVQSTEGLQLRSPDKPRSTSVTSSSIYAEVPCALSHITNHSRDGERT